MPAAGVPEIVAVPLAWAVKLSPSGRVLVGESDSVGVGYPVGVILNDDVVPASKVADVGEEMVGAGVKTAGGAVTWRVKLAVAFGATPLLAVTVME